ncbi:DUF4124 domain-containing protein [Dyella sp. GSA-30]|uniref:DUF4124 domain-containing protein n=1 Tax=Dyella sp. GSA-30 TaxID=2994496 RepID=UPI002493658E|nr:DUF4124 domain-containing protein [Dyella sp. GSA-30]
MNNLAFVALALASEGLCAQQVYKWTDAAGTVHYEEHPQAKNAKLVELKGGVDTPVRSMADAPQLTVSKADVDQMDKTQRVHLCQVARDNLKRIDGQAAVVDSSDIHAARLLSSDDRLKARGDAQAQIGSYCDDK